eukprot:TRINITY_DN3211_c0_g3_i2.p1 TRINITY_DN3211_c0_g3~~TRINITY_DN3211_c0_g3_i2.p1  ORF type:complete len:220 (+),score=57.84 TRINITY_DN3211_c0_g3_i2:108-767(+)
MTTAHKPTWNAAVGSDEQGGTLRGPSSRMISAKNLPSHTKLHYRKEGQNAPSDLQGRNFREDLEERERQVSAKREDETSRPLEEVKRRRIEEPKEPTFNPLDRDDPDSFEESSESTSKSDSEEAELMREVEKLTQEREEEKRRLDEERRAAELQNKAEGILRGNPLLNPDKEDFNLKKKWNDDVVFKHQSRSEPVKKQRFINDTTRNDFHRKFLNKYVK